MRVNWVFVKFSVTINMNGLWDPTGIESIGIKSDLRVTPKRVTRITKPNTTLRQKKYY